MKVQCGQRCRIEDLFIKRSSIIHRCSESGQGWGRVQSHKYLGPPGFHELTSIHISVGGTEVAAIWWDDLIWSKRSSIRVPERSLPSELLELHQRCETMRDSVTN